MTMVWVRSPVYFYKRKDTYYFSRAVPADLRHRFNKKKVEVSLRTKSEVKAAKSAAALSDRLERYWDSLRMEQIHLKELGLTVVSQSPITPQQHSVSIDDALACYHRLKGSDRNELFFEAGDLQLFKGRYSLHRVSPLRGKTPRHVAIFSYVEEPDMVGSPERTKQLYGRILPIHLERAGLRADNYID